MARLIDADKLWLVTDADGHQYYEKFEIDNAPTIDAVSVQHGKWIDVNGDGSLYRCSVCGETQCCNSNYCGECGAQMEIEAWSEPILYLFPI